VGTEGFLKIRSAQHVGSAGCLPKSIVPTVQAEKFSIVFSEALESKAFIEN
jgi:hypothetical protein